jgi:hypothetical protein
MDELFQKNKYLFHVPLPSGLPIKFACTFFLFHMPVIMGKAQPVVVDERVTKHWANRERHQHAKKLYVA